MVVDLTKDMILAIHVAFAELETGEWTQYVTEEDAERVSEGQSALEKILPENNGEL
jgi:hypothetical protein